MSLLVDEEHYTLSITKISKDKFLVEFFINDILENFGYHDTWKVANDLDHWSNSVTGDVVNEINCAEEEIIKIESSYKISYNRFFDKEI